MCEIEVFLMVDEQGNAVVSLNEEDLGDLYDSADYGDHSQARRIIILNVAVPPMDPMKINITIPPEPQSATIKVITKQ